ncbi:MAG: hypothetical protein U0930_15520 [Pirellulales bacterium]
MRNLSAQSTSNTLVFVANGWIARIDFAGRWRSKLVSLKASPWKPSTTTDHLLCEGIEQAIGLDQKPCRKLSIVSPLVWTGFLTIPTDVVQIASSIELAQALAIEAECETGISAFASKLVFQQIDATQKNKTSFCVSQIDEDVFSQVDLLLNSKGIKLISIAHPASIHSTSILASPIDSASVHPEQKEQRPISSLADSLRKFLSAWKQFEQEPYTVDAFQSVVQQLASAWNRPSNRNNRLQILPESRRMKLPTTAVSLTLASLTAGLCWSWNQRLDTQISNTRAQLQKTEKQQEKAKEIESDTKRLDTKLVQLRKDLTAAQMTQQTSELKAQQALRLQARRNERWSILLDSLAKSNTDCWIQHIEYESSQTLLHGLAVSQSAAQRFAVELELNLAVSGWYVSPAVTNPLNSELLSFIVSLTPDDTLPIISSARQQIVTNETSSQAEANDIAIMEFSL